MPPRLAFQEELSQHMMLFAWLALWTLGPLQILMRPFNFGTGQRYVLACQSRHGCKLGCHVPVQASSLACVLSVGFKPHAGRIWAEIAGFFILSCSVLLSLAGFALESFLC